MIENKKDSNLLPKNVYHRFERCESDLKPSAYF